MKAKSIDSIFDARVGAARVSSRGYADDEVSQALARAAHFLGWAGGRGPLAGVIAEGARVLVKPNWVMHRNQGPWGIEPLITHATLIRASVEAALAAGASRVIVGDAPVQGCDFDELIIASGIKEWAEKLKESEPRFQGVRDFRRTKCVFREGVRQASENLLPEEEFILFDLAGDSLLEPISDGRESFRVTCYDPRLLARTHTRGRHQYLIAREVVESDVIINLPKLKTHKKAGITCALKNLIGINGNKEYLPHHRIGGALTGGDCYPGRSRLKRALEQTLDRQNSSRSQAAGKLYSTVASQLDRVARLMGDQIGVEGSWSGNDTVWRTGLDLNRILLYGRTDAQLSDEPQRRVIHIVDAIIGGQGDGPLAPEPLPLGLVLMGSNAAAVDHVGAHILRYDPARISIAREAFGGFRWPIAAFRSCDVELVGDMGTGRADELLAAREFDTQVLHPAGWRDAAII
jgi:uncharacterized protein (DUF362 family)